MKLKRMKTLYAGFYTIHWKSGGYSSAAIGISDNGYCWIAPILWSRVLYPHSKDYKKYIKNIKKLERLKCHDVY